jgi:RHS repeat-associated protein
LLQDESIASQRPGYVSTQATSLLYAGEYFDSDSQHYYNRARWYNPLTGLFNRVDPFAGNLNDPQSLHKYLYCHADPVMGIDPTGQMTYTETLSVMNIIAHIFVTIAPFIVAAGMIAASTAIFINDILPPILDIIAEGIEGAEKLYAAALAYVMAASIAHNKAMSKAARALGKTIKEMRKLKPYFVFEFATPNIYKFTVSCLLLNPTWYCLTWHANHAWTVRNRAWVESVYGHLRKPGYSIDEFPYASTAEGGWPAARGCPVPWLENCAQGGYLKAFYYGILRKPSKFLVVPVPK